MTWKVRLISLLCVWLAVGGESTLAGPPVTRERGDLDRFEEEATKDEKDDEADDSETCEVDDDDFTDGFLWELGRLCFYSSIYGGVGSWVRVHGASSEEMVKEFPRRVVGEPLIPFLTVEGQYQDIHRDISATFWRTEVGYGPLGFEYRATKFREKYPVDTMTLTQSHFLYRMCFSRYVGVNLGAGMATLTGTRETTGFSLTVPVQVYPWKSLGMEFRPAWTRIHDHTLGDYSLALVARYSVLSVSAGYRWVSTGNSVLDGPVVGVAVHF